MEYSKVGWARNYGVTGFFEGFHDEFCREKVKVMVQSMVVQKLTSYTEYLWVRGLLVGCARQDKFAYF